MEQDTNRPTELDHPEGHLGIETPMEVSDAGGPTGVILHHTSDRSGPHDSSFNDAIVSMVDMRLDNIDESELQRDEAASSFPIEHLMEGPGQRGECYGMNRVGTGSTIEDIAVWFQEEYMRSNACVALEQEEWSNQWNTVRER